MSLSGLVSQAFVAYTIEVDNEFEHRMPHRTAADRGNLAAALSGDGRGAIASRLRRAV